SHAPNSSIKLRDTIFFTIPLRRRFDCNHFHPPPHNRSIPHPEESFSQNSSRLTKGSEAQFSAPPRACVLVLLLRSLKRKKSPTCVTCEKCFQRNFLVVPESMEITYCTLTRG
ncbi:hypothetical protein TNIN_89031, partial [Trichonephila inaurata madagascariensis]